MLDSISAQEGILDIVKEFTVKKELWFAASTQSNNVLQDTLKNPLHKLLPQILFTGNDDNFEEQFTGFKMPTEKANFMNLLFYAKH